MSEPKWSKVKKAREAKRAEDEASAKRIMREGVADGTYCSGCEQLKSGCDCGDGIAAEWSATHDGDYRYEETL